MNRRNFFKKLSGAVVGCYLGCQIKLPDFRIHVEKLAVDSFYKKADDKMFFLDSCFPSPNLKLIHKEFFPEYFS